MFKYVKNFEQFINDKSYGYNCVKLELIVNKVEWMKLQEMIDDEDIYITDSIKGRENEQHITILNGLYKENNDNEIKEAIQSIVFTEPIIILQYLSLFENDEYDVLKFDTDYKDLYKMNKVLSNFSHIDDYQDYQPHCTVAYLKPGIGKKYIRKLEIPIIAKPGKIIYSKYNDEKLYWDLNKK